MNDLSSEESHDLPLHCDNRFQRHTPTTTKVIFESGENESVQEKIQGVQLVLYYKKIRTVVLHRVFSLTQYSNVILTFTNINLSQVKNVCIKTEY